MSATVFMRRFFRTHRQAAAVGVALLCSGRCAIGAHHLPADRFDYGSAIASSTDEQMLLNLVPLETEAEFNGRAKLIQIRFRPNAIS